MALNFTQKKVPKYFTESKRLLKILYNYNKRKCTNTIHKENKVFKIANLYKLSSKKLIYKKVLHYPYKTNIAHNDIKHIDHKGRNTKSN